MRYNVLERIERESLRMWLPRLIGVFMLCVSIHGVHALESVAIQSTAFPSSHVRVPPCTEDQYVGVSGTQFVCKSVSQYGSVLYAKRVTHTNYHEYNAIINKWISTMTVATPQEKLTWQTACLTPNGQINTSTPPLMWEYCMRPICAHETGKWPFMARATDYCNEGNGSVACNNGRFVIIASCLTEGDEDASSQ